MPTVHTYRCRIDYDKDPESKKEKVVERQRVDEELRRQLATADPYFCALCSTCCLHLSKACSLEGVPRRGTDGSSVIDEATQLRRLSVVRGPPKAVRREKGVERQFPVHCPACDIPIGYRPAPLDEPTRFLYIYDGALKANKRTEVDVAALLGVSEAKIIAAETAVEVAPSAGASERTNAPSACDSQDVVSRAELPAPQFMAPDAALHLHSIAVSAVAPLTSQPAPSDASSETEALIAKLDQTPPESLTGGAGSKRFRDSDG